MVATPTWDERTQEAIRLLQAGRYNDAAALYRALLDEAQALKVAL